MNSSKIKKLRIGVIGLKGLPAFGGAATVGENIIHELKDQFDFRVYAISSHANKDHQSDSYQQIVFSKFFIKKFNIFYYYLCAAFHAVFCSRYDLIHLHHVDGAFILPILRLRYKVIVTSHAQPQVNEKWPFYVKLFFIMNERIALGLSNAFTVVSRVLKEVVEKINPKKEIIYIPNGINLNQAIAEGKPVSDDYILFAAGRIIPLKGLNTLIEAYKMGNFTQKLVIIGSLDHMPRYKEEIYNLSQGLNIEFVPLIKEKERLLQYVKYASVFVFPSYSEAMSIMLLEAAYTRVPVVCSDIPANTAIFDGNETIFFRTNDSEDLKEKIEYALNNRMAVESRIEAAYSKLGTMYNWPKIASQYAYLYNKLGI